MTSTPTGRKRTAPRPNNVGHGDGGSTRSRHHWQKGQRHIGWTLAGSLLSGAFAALLLPMAPFIPATESGVVGAILLGFAFGWAMIAVLSGRYTGELQRWAAVSALFMGTGGLLLVAVGHPAREVLAWVWPPALLVLAVWIMVQSHRQLHSRGGRLMLYPVLAGMVLAGLGGGFEAAHSAADRAASPEQGQLIDVGGHRLYLSCTGSGSPTVVLEPGAGMMSSDLGWIAPAVARHTRVCVYDRAGRGWSGKAAVVQDGEQIASDLRALLQGGDVTGPYVLAGHSFGGLYALTFAARYPEDVAGLVLIDSTAPASGPDGEHHISPDPDTTSRISALVSGAARLGLARWLGATPDHLGSTVDEYLHAGSSVQQAAVLKTLADKPLAVLTAGTGSRSGWETSQKALAALSTNSTHQIVAEASHASLITDQEDAAATAAAIVDVVSAVRAAR